MRLTLSEFKKEILEGYGVTGSDRTTQDIALELIDRVDQLTEALKEVSLPPYKDSDPHSLLQSLRRRAIVVMEKYGSDVPIQFGTENECGAV